MSLEGWREVKLGDVVEINKNNYSARDNWDYINYLDTGNITENRIDSIQYLDTKTDKIPSRAKRKVNANEIIYSTVRPNQKHYGIIKKPLKNMLVSTGFAVINGKDKLAHNSFLYWYLAQESIVELLHTIGEHSTSAYPSIKPSDIEGLDINLPPLTEQKAIAATLSALDDMIELNNQINKTLEEMAQAIFKSWFVDFEPFKDGDFEESELGLIPKGWRVGMLGEIAESRSILCRRKDIESGSRYVGLEHIPRHELIISEAGIIEDVSSDKLLFRDKQVLFGKIRPYFHKVSIAPWGGYCSTDAIVLEPKEREFFSFFSLAVFSIDFVKYAVLISQGTKMPRAEWKSLRMYRFVIPPNDIAERFDNIISPIIDVMILNIRKNEKLKQIRDTLLPKLMSGEIRVPLEEVPYVKP